MNPSLLRFLSLTFALWGTPVAVWFITRAHSETVTPLVVGLSALLLLLSSWPIAAAEGMGVPGKVLGTLGYLLVSCIVILILGLFLLCMHKCS